MSRDNELFIHSAQNKVYKNLKKLSSSNQFRKKSGLFLVEGTKENLLALKAGLFPENIILRQGTSLDPSLALDDIVISLSDALFEDLIYREQSDFLGVYREPVSSLDHLNISATPLIIIVESVEKPGNLGAILRTADAVHADALLIADTRVDLFNPNVIRSSVGTLFTVPKAQAQNEAVLAWCRAHHLKIYAAALEHSVSYTDVDMLLGCALVFGTEDQGLSSFWLEHADAIIKIPMLGMNDSLNVSNSVAVIAYEAIRQRSVSNSI